MHKNILIAVLLAAGGARGDTHQVGPACDGRYTTANGRASECELRDDADGVVDGRVVLSQSLRLAPFTKLNGLAMAEPCCEDGRETW